MPTYSYACKDCGYQFDIVQSFKDDSLSECPQCSGYLRKLFNSVGIVFKGSGFYRNDSRSGSGSTAAKSESTSTSSSTTSARSSTSGGSDSGAATSSSSASSSGSGDSGGSKLPAASSSGT